MRTSSKREQLIKTATALFAKQGFHGTGIDAIVEKSGVTKRTLYTYFRSKEELVLAVLRDHDGQFRNFFMRQVEEKGRTPKSRLLAVFDVADKWFKQEKFFGCIFINAIGEYSDRDTPIRQVCKEFKKMMKSYIKDLCQQAGLGDAEKLSEELALLLEGAIVTAQVSGTGNAAQIAKRTAKMVINQAIPHKG